MGSETGEGGGEEYLLIGGVLMPMGWTVRPTSSWIPWNRGYESTIREAGVYVSLAGFQTALPGKTQLKEIVFLSSEGDTGASCRAPSGAVDPTHCPHLE